MRSTWKKVAGREESQNKVEDQKGGELCSGQNTTAAYRDATPPERDCTTAVRPLPWRSQTRRSSGQRMRRWSWPLKWPSLYERRSSRKRILRLNLSFQKLIAQRPDRLCCPTMRGGAGAVRTAENTMADGIAARKRITSTSQRSRSST